MKKLKKFTFRTAGIAALCLALGAAGYGGAAGVSAVFTDHKTINQATNVGTMNMKLTDLSDLDGQYGTVNTSTGVTTGAVTTGGYQGLTYTRPTAKDASNPSKGVINPGDDGIYAYQISNTAEKSFDTAKVTTVTVKIKNTDPAGQPAALTLASDKNAYVIEGLGTPYAKLVDNQTIQLTYASNDTEVLSGSLEKDGKGNTAAYAYNTAFARNSKNKFQDCDVTIDTTVYAKQHRNSIDSKLSVDTSTGKIEGTGDWAQIGSFETVLDN